MSTGNPTRAETLKSLKEQILDVLVIGGGIVGAGVARDAAMRGLRTGVVEQLDFAFGTSSRSSRLLHGGLRYLAQGRVGLVREASVEKTILRRIAPHLAEPLPFVFPTYRHSGWPLWQLRIGVQVYDWLCSGKNLGKSGSQTAGEILAHFPHLKANELIGGVRYFDAFTNDARLVIDSLRSAVKHGALVSNYARFKTANRQNGHWVCELENRLTGNKFTARARGIVNATGPWAAGLPHSHVKLRLTKGVHVVLERQRLPVPEAVALTEGRRLLFVIPWGERTIVGTTDTDYDGPLEDVRPLPADIKYLLGALNDFFPSAAIKETHLVSAWAGLRPLIATPENLLSRWRGLFSGQSSAKNGAPSDISRSHQILNPETGWWDLIGGKLTTYRLMAEQALDQIVKWLGSVEQLKVETRLCRTAEEPLLLPSETQGVSGILPPAFGRQIIEHYCKHEWAVHLEDLMVRRTGWHCYFNDAPEKAVQVADSMAVCLNWTAEEKAAELENYRLLFRATKG